MKRVLYFLSGTVCLLIAVAFILLFSGTFGSTASSYITTANQYGKVQTTVPAILNGEVNISFHNGSLPNSTEYDTTNTVYVESSYSSSSSSRHYAMKIDDVGLVSGSTNVYGLTDYYDTRITDESLDPLDFVDFFGVVKSKESYGTLTNTITEETYTMPLVTEKSVGDTSDDKGDGYTTLNITPFKEKVQVTVYFTMRTTDNSGNARSNPYYAFYFNGEEIYYNNGTTTDSTSSTGVEKSTYDETDDCYKLGDYTFTAGKDTDDNKSISTHELYSYTTVLDAETATNIMTGTDNQTMIFLIVLEPYNPLTVTDNDGNISGTVAGNGIQTLNVSYDASKADTTTATVTEFTVTSSDESVATASISKDTEDGKYTVSVEPVGVGKTTITVYIKNSASEEYSKEYTLTVENALKLEDSYTVSAKGSECTITPSFAFDVSSDTVSYAVSSGNENVATVSESDETITVTGMSPGSADITVTATVDGIYYTSTTTVYVNGYVIKAADGTTTTTVYKEKTLELGLYAVTNGAVADYASTDLSVTWSSSDTAVATVDNGTVTGVAAGDVTITATIGGVEYSISLTVSEPSIEIADEYIIIGTSASSTVNVTYDVITYDDIGSGEISVTDSSGSAVSDSTITAAVSDSSLTITTSDATTGVYKVTITDSDTGATDYIYVVVGTEETKNVSYTATYTINSNASGAKDESAFDVSVIDDSDSDATDSSGAITVSGGGSNGITHNPDSKTYTNYSEYSEFKTSRYAIIKVDDAASISKITVYASTGNTTRILYITTSEPSSSTPVDSAIKASGSSTGNTFNISADSLSGGTYYVWATDTIKVYAIVIEYTVAETTVNISSVRTSTVSIIGTGSSTITCTAGSEVISLDTSIATVEESNGTVTITGVAAGTTYILVNDNDTLKVYEVTVT